MKWIVAFISLQILLIGPLFSQAYINTSGCDGDTAIIYDGYTYNLVEIDGQCWFAENLKTSIYCNNDTIPNVITNSIWSALNTGAWGNYQHLSSNGDDYGKLYNWYTVGDSRNICPCGWHVPTETEWTGLINYLGGSTVAGGAMKESDTLFWKSPNNGATNSSGFSGLPGGYRDDNGSTYKYITERSYWWSTTEHSSDSTKAKWMGLKYNDAYASNGGNSDKKRGFSVRCVKDSTIQTSINRTYLQGDLKIYPNPFSFSTTIEMPSSETYTLNIYDIAGNMLRSEVFTDKTIIPRGLLAKGFYIIEAKSKSQTHEGTLFVK